MKLRCPRCRHTIPAADINIQAMTALCRACADIVAIDPANRDDDAPLATPARFRLDADPARDAGPAVNRAFAVSWSWWRWHHLVLLFFCGIWDGFLLVWYAAITTHLGTMGWAAIIFLVFPVLHVAVGAAMTWFAIAAICNRTTITCTGELLTIRHGPIPWPGNHAFHAADRAGLRAGVPQRRHQDDDDEVDARTAYALILPRPAGDLELLKDLSAPEARWLRQRILACLPPLPAP